MTQEPQFEHKNPGLSGGSRGLENVLRGRWAGSYNAAAVLLKCGAGRNEASGFGLMALLERGTAAGGRPRRIRRRQMGIPQ